MTYDHHDIISIKNKYPQIKIGLIDPRSQDVFNSTIHCDFLIDRLHQFHPSFDGDSSHLYY